MEILTHWKKLYNYNYLGSQDLENGDDQVVTVKSIKKEMVTSTGGRKEECTICRFNELEKAMILNKTNAKTIMAIYDTPYIEKWVGKVIQLYIEHSIKFQGETVSGLRIRPYKPRVIDTNVEYNTMFERLKTLMTNYKGEDLKALKEGLTKHRNNKTLTVEVLKQYIAKLQQ